VIAGLDAMADQQIAQPRDLATQPGEFAHDLLLSADRPVLAVAACGRTAARQQAGDCSADPGQVGALLDQNLGGETTALADQGEQDMLGADEQMTESRGFAQGDEGPSWPSA
jgi:hypothetical protein